MSEFVWSRKLGLVVSISQNFMIKAQEAGWTEATMAEVEAM
jgi:hypothetical protein